MNLAAAIIWGFGATVVLTTLLRATQALGLTRIDLPFILGSAFTANRDRAKALFRPETRRPTYGLTKPVGTYNIWDLQTHEYRAIARDWRSASSWRDKLGYVFGPPGWAPADRSAAVSSSRS